MEGTGDKVHPRGKENRDKKDNDETAVVDEEGEELLDINPMKKTCQYCNNEVVTYVEHETSPVFYGFLFVSMFLFGWMFLILAPFAYLLLKNAVHRCSRWLNEIGVRHTFGIPDISQEILVFQLGKCSVVISRTVGVAIFTVLSIIFLYFSWFYDFGLSEEAHFRNKQSVKIEYPWTEFIEDCGSKVIIGNNVKANEIFKRKYQNNFVSWYGYFISKKEVSSFSLGENSHALNILVKMEPSETEIEPDLVLSLSGSGYSNLKDLIDSLRSGDQITFNAKFISLGDEFNVNHLHALSITKTGTYKALPEIMIIEDALPKTIPADADAPPPGN